AADVDVDVPEEHRLDPGGLRRPAGGVHPGTEALVERPQQVAFPGGAGLPAVVVPGAGLVERVHAGQAAEVGGGQVVVQVAERVLGHVEEGVLDADRPGGGGQDAVVPEVRGGVLDGRVVDVVLAPVGAQPAGLGGVAARSDQPGGRAVPGVPAALVEQGAGVEVLVEVEQHVDAAPGEGADLLGEGVQVARVNRAGGGLGARPGDQDAGEVRAGEAAHGGGGGVRVGGGGEGKVAVLGELGLAGDVEAAEHDLAAVAVPQDGRAGGVAAHGDRVGGGGVEPQRPVGGRGAGGGAEQRPGEEEDGGRGGAAALRANARAQGHAHDTDTASGFREDRVPPVCADVGIRRR